MKKFISILLAVVMVFTTMPLVTLADEVYVDSDSFFDDISVVEETAPDYSAYNSILKLVEALDEKEYTKESIDAVKATVVDKAELTTQDDVDDAVRKIAFAYANLEKNSFEIDFTIIDSNGDEETQTYTYYYGEEALFKVDNGENIYKWIISDDESDKKLNSTNEELSLVIKEAYSVTAFTDVEVDEYELQQVKFLSFNGKILNIVYTEDINNVEMPDAPNLPFYYFSEWVRLNDYTYQAKYLSDTICDGTNHRFTSMVCPATCETYGYVIFQCSCGIGFMTDYSDPIGHSYNDSSDHCLNGCGTYKPIDEDDLPSGGSSYIPEEPTTTVPEEDEKDYGFDEDGYNNVVVTP